MKGRFCEETDTLLILPAGLKTEACPYHHLITLQPMKLTVSTRIAQIWNQLSRSPGSLYHLYGNGITNNIIRNTIRFLPSNRLRRGCIAIHAIHLSTHECPYCVTQTDGWKSGLSNHRAGSQQSRYHHFWHLDNTYLTQTQDFHKISLQPTPGKHSLTAVDEAGNTVTTTFYIN